MLLEICIDGPDGLAAAVAGGADRVEVCSALELGGLTPSMALVARSVASGLPAHAMIRPRSGGFRYSIAEVAVMMDDVARMRDAGVAGVVVGAIDDAGLLDQALMTRFRRAADGIALTLHRAIDLIADPVAAIGQAAAIGVDLVLTSGGARSAEAGRAAIARMVAAAPPSLAVIAGAGITPANVAALIATTGVRQVHASAGRLVEAQDAATTALGFDTGGRRATDAALVARLKAAMTDQPR